MQTKKWSDKNYSLFFFFVITHRGKKRSRKKKKEKMKRGRALNQSSGGE